MSPVDFPNLIRSFAVFTAKFYLLPALQVDMAATKKGSKNSNSYSVLWSSKSTYAFFMYKCSKNHKEKTSKNKSRIQDITHE